MKFKNIKQFPHSSYFVHVELAYLKEHMERWDTKSEKLPNHFLVMEPEFQRGHVWSKDQQIKFMEYMLKGGKTGRDVYFNCSSWQIEYNTPIYCVDGLQRITAALAFLNNEIPVFGAYFHEYEDKPREAHFIFHVLKLRSKKELLNIYVDLNSGGTPHNQVEIDRVKKMIEETSESETI